MARFRIALACSLVTLSASAFLLSASADETSSGDKLRILHSNHFTFTDSGYPLVTIELSSGRDRVRLSSEHGIVVQPDGDGGSQISGGDAWELTVEQAVPGVIREWTVVATLASAEPDATEAALARWRARGFQPRQFEIGTMFGVEGEIIDSRQWLLAVAPVAKGRGAARARAIGKEYDITTRVHRELVERPRGTIVARSGDVVVRNPSVIWFAPSRANQTLAVDGIAVGAGGSQLKVRHETRRYFGRIYVTLGSDGALTVVNAVPADRLLAGLVPAEIFPSAAAEALAAQAVAARTELLQKIGTRHLTDPFLLCSSQHCQVYAGAGKEHPRTTRAVQQTRGQVLLRKNGGLVDARYSASCGGHGEHNEHIWGGAPDAALRGHLDVSRTSRLRKRFAGGIDEHNIDAFLGLSPTTSYCGSTRFAKNRFRWNKQISVAELSRRVARKYPRVGRVHSLEPLARGRSGRIKELRISGDKGVSVVRGDLHIRRLLGGLRSSLFVVRRVKEGRDAEFFEFRGAGFGHGVGMCQTGAIGMAESGIPVATILRHYYPGSRLKRLY